MSDVLHDQKEIYRIGQLRSKDDFMMFSIHTDRKYVPNWHHKILSDALMDVESGKIDRLLVTMPPRHGKSELCSIKFPAWYMGRNPDKQIICASYSGDLALDFGRKCRNLVREQDVFDVRLAEDSKSAGAWNTDRGGQYVAIGVGGVCSGRGAHVLLIDDPIKNREEAESIVIRNKVWDWYTSTAYSRLEERGAIIIVQTMWQSDDLAGRLLAGTGDKFVHINFPAIAEEDEEYRKTGDALWPAKYPIDVLNRIKDNVGVYDWSALFQQKPVSREAQEFKEEWIRYYDTCAEKMSVFITVDPAISKKDSACDSVIMVCGVTEGHDIYVLDYIAEKLNPSELLDEIFNLSKLYSPDIVGIESIAYQKALCHFLEIRMEKENLWLNNIEIKSSGEKETRIRGLIPYFRHGKVFIKKGMTKLAEQLFSFPNAKLVDVIDALSMQLEIIYRPDIVKKETSDVPYANDKDSPWYSDGQIKSMKDIYGYK